MRELEPGTTVLPWGHKWTLNAWPALLLPILRASWHCNQRLFRLYHGLETCLLIVYLALTAGRHTLQEFIAILLLTVLFEIYFWVAGNLILAAEAIAGVGLHLQQAETATEFSQRITAQVPECSSGLSRLAELFVKARYNPSSVSTEDVLVARDALQELKTCVHPMHGETRTTRGQERRFH